MYGVRPGDTLDTDFPLTPADLKDYGATIGDGCAGWRQVSDACPLARCLSLKTGWSNIQVYATKIVHGSGELSVPVWARHFIRLTDLEPYDWLAGDEVVALTDRAVRMARLEAQAELARLDLD
jgi:hypothetical protein